MNTGKTGSLCVFGNYQDTELYPRNRELIKAVSSNFDAVVEVRPSKRFSSAIKYSDVTGPWAFLKSTVFSFGSLLSLFRQARVVRSADMVFVPYPAYLVLFVLRAIFIGRRKPKLLVDSFICLHDTLVNDRKIIKPGGVAARCVAWLEALTLRSADLVFIDTWQQRDLLVKSYGLSEQAVIVTPVGINEAIWSPLDPLPLCKNFRFLFWGTFIPLHGVDYIVKAAEIVAESCPEIEVRLIGDGQTANQIAMQISSLCLSNISWERSLVSALELRSELERSHCVLGVFGATEKAGNVIPYKVYQAMASNKTVITREGSAISQIIPAQSEYSGLVLVPPGDPRALASAMIGVFNDYQATQHRVRTRELYERYLSNSVLCSTVAEALQNI